MKSIRIRKENEEQEEFDKFERYLEESDEEFKATKREVESLRYAIYRYIRIEEMKREIEGLELQIKEIGEMEDERNR